MNNKTGNFQSALDPPTKQLFNTGVSVTQKQSTATRN